MNLSIFVINLYTTKLTTSSTKYFRNKKIKLFLKFEVKSKYFHYIRSRRYFLSLSRIGGQYQILSIKSLIQGIVRYFRKGGDDGEKVYL